MPYLVIILSAGALTALCCAVLRDFVENALQHISPGFLSFSVNGRQRTLSHFLWIFLICATVIGCANEFDKEYDAVMSSGMTSFQNNDFNKAADTYLKAIQIRQTSNDQLNRDKALKGFFESCYHVNVAERASLLSKMKASLTSMSPDEQEGFLFFSTGKADIDSSVLAEVRSTTAEILRKRLSSQGSWKEALALELRIAGVAVREIGDDQMTIAHREYHPIWLFGKVNPPADRSKIEKTVREFAINHPEIGQHDSVAYFDEEQKGTLVKICDL